MKIAFKAWNVLIILWDIILILNALKGGTVAVVIAVLLASFSLIMAYAGLKEDYYLCKKLASVVLVLNAVSLITSGFAAGAIFSLIIAAIYMFMCVSLDTKY